MALTDKLTAIADAIRGKTGKTDGLTLDQMPAEIEGIQGGGGEFYFTPYGVGYTPNMVLDCTVIVTPAWKGADNIKSLELTEWNPTDSLHLNQQNGASLNDVFGYNSLETLLLPKLQYGGHYWARGSTNLKTVQIGSVGFPVTGGIGSLFFKDCTQTGLTITVYVDATTLADAKTKTGAPPWGATNATIIYRNSITGEVITE